MDIVGIALLKVISETALLYEVSLQYNEVFRVHKLDILYLKNSLLVAEDAIYVMYVIYFIT